MKALFMGGCLLTTKTVAREQRFIQVLLSRNAHLQIDLARYSSYSLVEEIFSSHTSADVPEVAVFLVRPFPFFTLTKMFPRVPKPKGGVEVKIHPGIFSGKSGEWFVENDRLIVEMDWNPNGTKRSYTHSLNLKLGTLFQLDRWAIDYVKGRILALEQACRQKNVRLIVIGPPAVQNDAQERGLLVKLNGELLSSFKKLKITYVNLFSSDFPDSFLGEDKVHYDPNGHFKLAQKIEQELFQLK